MHDVSARAVLHPSDAARLAILAAQSEREFQGLIEELAVMRGWVKYHTRDSRGSDPGFPDLTLCREMPDGSAQLLFIECKTMAGRVTEDQRKWLDRLRRVPGAYTIVARPSDWETIERILA